MSNWPTATAANAYHESYRLFKEAWDDLGLPGALYNLYEVEVEHGRFVFDYASPSLKLLVAITRLPLHKLSYQYQEDCNWLARKGWTVAHVNVDPKDHVKERLQLELCTLLKRDEGFRKFVNRWKTSECPTK